MRYLLATVSLIISALCLTYCALFVWGVAQYLIEEGTDSWQLEVVSILVIGGGSILVGVGFLITGLLVLQGKPRRQQ
jgi:hypothetical protein